MQTFVPYPDLRVSCQVLDSRRLGKQRVETFQILRALTWPGYAWKNHPAVRMWRGFVPGLVRYGVECCDEWTRRGHADTVRPQLLAWTAGQVPQDPPVPPWFGDPALHLSHRARLVAKDPHTYRPLFGDLPDLPYVWPPDSFPRWPVRRGERELDLDGALAELGLTAALPGQAEAAHALHAGRDVLLVARPGAGGPTAGLLGGLLTPGRTVWLGPDVHPAPDQVPPVTPVPPRESAPTATSVAPAGPTSRRPSAVDAAATAAEAAPPEWVFTAPRELPRVGPSDHDLPGGPAGTGLVVLEDADRLPRLGLPGDRPPLLALVDRADGAARAALAARHDLRDPLHAGGGWDVPATWLGVVRVGSAADRRQLVAALVRAAGPALVLAAGRDRTDRLAGGLVTGGPRAPGLRAASWATAMRPGRADAALAAFRARRLDALVVSRDDLPSLGRGRLRLLLAADPPPDQQAWRDLLAATVPVAAVLLVGPDAPAAVRGWADSPGCRRAALLEPYGEPVTVPCGRCDVCAPGSGPAPLSGGGAGP